MVIAPSPESLAREDAAASAALSGSESIEDISAWMLFFSLVLGAVVLMRLFRKYLYPISVGILPADVCGCCKKPIAVS